MATYSAIRTKIKNIVQDSRYTGIINALINQGQLEIAGGMKSALGTWLTPPLPELLVIGTIDTATDAAYVSMPSNFQRNLQFVVAENGNEINIEHSFNDFVETYPLLDQSGTISACCEFGKNFYYQGIPTTSEEVTIHYYKEPTDMAAADSKPDGIPKHLQIPLLLNYTVWKIFELLVAEDVIHETNRQIILDQFYRKMLIHKELFFVALHDLELSIPLNIKSLNLISTV